MIPQEWRLAPGTACQGNTPLALAISGVFEIDLDNLPASAGGIYCMKRTNIKMSPNAQIIVSGSPGKKLIMEEAQIFTCIAVWQRILVQPGVELIMDKCTVEDGIEALTLSGGAIAHLRDNTFRNNHIGVYVPPGPATGQNVDFRSFFGNRFESAGNGLKPPLPYTGQKGTAGVWLNDVLGATIGLEDETENTFYNLYNGVVAHNSNLSIRNSYFRAIEPASGPNAPAFSGHGVHASGTEPFLRVLDVKGLGKYGPAAFEDCRTGIYADKMAAHIEHCNMEGVYNGIHLQNGRAKRLTVLRNNIKATDAGINLFQNTPARCNVEDNEITIQAINWGMGTGIRMEEAPTGVQNYNSYTVQRNLIHMNTAATGIRLQAGRYVQLYDNTIHLKEGTSFQDGISLAGAGNALVRCNTVSGPASSTFSYPNRGVVTYGSFGSALLCNTTDNMRTGYTFYGMADATALRGNNLRRHATGLQILDNGHIGEQAHQGNRWFGPFAEFGAKHLALDFEVVEQSRFRVDPAASSGQAFAFEPSWSAVGLWFVPDPVNETEIFQCQTPTYDACQTAAPPVNFAEMGILEEKLAMGTFASPQFTAELGWTGRRHLYSRIAENDFPLQPGTPIDTFYAGGAGGGLIPQLHTARQRIQGAFALSPAEEAQLEQQHLDLQNRLSELRANSYGWKDADLEIGDPVLETARNAVYAGLQADASAADALAEDLLDHATSQLALAKTLNAAIPATAVYEINEKSVNELYIAWVETGEFTPTQKGELADIAFQCPWSGGDAVFFARSLYALIDPDAGYDDELLCSVGGQYRALPTQTRTLEAGFEIYPNPAGDYVVIRTAGIEDNARASVVLYDLMGREILRTAVAGNTDFILNTEQVHTGLFWVALSVDGQRVGVRKIVIKR
ncbi:MAG: T9SS type A sorting domain-containing protein [Saprospiraceae bacterium]|nr:T9SS type A sorting domain-containing protein [Saprospiraceae bacterium]